MEELRDLVYNKELDKALLISFNNTIKFVIDNNQLIHNRTVDARNYLIKNKRFQQILINNRSENCTRLSKNLYKPIL